MSDPRREEEDFATLLREEILSAKRKRQEAVEVTGGRKYLKRGDLERGLGRKPGEGHGSPTIDEKAEDYQEDNKDAAMLATALEEPQNEGAGSVKVQTGAKSDTSVDAPKSQEMKTLSKSRKESEIYQIGAMESESINPKGEFTKITPLILLFLRRLLHEQELALDSRSDAEKDSKEGRLASSIFAQSKSSLKILFKLLRRNTVPKDILKRLAEICSFMQQREYVQANDSYLKLAIGNAPWPIGVTAVGIHERSAQEKIKTAQIARTRLQEVTNFFLTKLPFCRRPQRRNHEKMASISKETNDLLSNKIST